MVMMNRESGEGVEFTFYLERIGDRSKCVEEEGISA